MALSLKQKLFVAYYIGKANGNATKAAKLAGYSEQTAYSQGPENLKKPEIIAEIQRFYTEKAMTAEEVLSRLADQARGIGGYVEVSDTGRVSVRVSEMVEDGLSHLVKSVKDTEHGQSIEFYDAQSALVNLGRNQKLFTDKTENTSDVTLTVYDDLSDTELDERIAALEAREAAAQAQEVS